MGTSTAFSALVGVAAPDSIDAPPAALDYARRLAQQDVPAALLIRAYRVGQARFLRHCIEELLHQSSGAHLEGLATLEMVETVSDYIDCVVEQVLTTYGLAAAMTGSTIAALCWRCGCASCCSTCRSTSTPRSGPSATASTSTTSAWWPGSTSPRRWTRSNASAGSSARSAGRWGTPRHRW